MLSSATSRTFAPSVQNFIAPQRRFRFDTSIIYFHVAMFFRDQIRGTIPSPDEKSPGGKFSACEKGDAQG
jgi:hypothetical protein